MVRLLKAVSLVWVLLAVVLVGDSVSTSSGTAEGSAVLDYFEPPIEVTFNVHFDPVVDDYAKWRERKNNLLWLKSFVESYSGQYRPKLNLQVQGDQAEFYLDPDDSEAAEGRAALANLHQAGHSFGTHAHNTLRAKDPHSWAYVPGNPTPAEEVEHWQDHIGWVEKLYAEITGSDDPELLRRMNASAAMFFPQGREAQQQAFSGAYSDPASGETVPHGFSVQTGGRNERFYCLFDHDVQNPWRPGTSGPLDEDLSNTDFVTIPQLPPLGKLGVHGHIPDCYQDNSVPSRQRMFVQVFLERLYREHTGAPDKVWTFGWHEHLFDLYPTGSRGPGRREFREEVGEMAEWLNQRFIGRTTAKGNLIAQYATVTEVRDGFEAWEEKNPGVTSFEYDRRNADWDAYPYELEGLARELANAHYEAALLPPDSTLQVYRFERCPSSLQGETQGYWAQAGDGGFGCYDRATDRGEPAGNPLSTTTVYVAWRDATQPEPTDLTAHVGDRAMAYDGVTGALLASDEELNAYPLDFRPVVILPGTTEASTALASTHPPDDVAPLRFFYAIHTHVQGDWAPYTDRGMTQLDPEVAENMLAAIEGIAGVLDKHGAKGTWEVVYGTSKGLCNYQGEGHVFQQLVDSGHEVGVHAHHTEDIEPAFGSLQDDCGITADVTSGFMIDVSDAGPQGAQEAASRAIEEALALGMTVGTENLSPGGRRNPFGRLCDNQLGVDNDMWEETGNLMFPWRPDYPNRNVCADNPEGKMVFVDHVGPDWMSLPGQGQGKVDVLTDANFDRLREMLDAALAYLEENRPQQVAAWGFVTHINEYAVGNRGENPPAPAALEASDRFLGYVDSKVEAGRVVYATASEIAEVAFPRASSSAAMATTNPVSLHTVHDVDRLPDGHTLITDGGQPGRGPGARPGVRPGSDSRILEVDDAGEVVWSFSEGLNWAHNADRLPGGNTLISNTGPNSVIEIDATGDVVWNSRDVRLSDGSTLRYPNDANRPENDHLLITDRDNHRVIEIDRDGTIVWQFGETGVPGDDATHLNGPHNADRLENGNTLIADSNNDRVSEVAPDGAIVWEYRPTGAEALDWPRDADRLENGNTLITDSRNGRIIEVTPAGEVVWMHSGLTGPYDADRLANGNTLISGAPGGGAIEVNPTGSIVWQYPPQETATSSGYLLISYNANYLWGPPVQVQQASAEPFVGTLNRHLDLMDRLGAKADYYLSLQDQGGRPICG